MSVGASLPRSDADAKVRGEARFGVDHELPGTLHAKLVRADIPAARVLGISVADALALDGVYGVITADDVPNERTGVILNDAPLFAQDYVAYEGEPLATPIVGFNEPDAYTDQLRDTIDSATMTLAALRGPRFSAVDGTPSAHSHK